MPDIIAVLPVQDALGIRWAFNRVQSDANGREEFALTIDDFIESTGLGGVVAAKVKARRSSTVSIHSYSQGQISSSFVFRNEGETVENAISAKDEGLSLNLIVDNTLMFKASYDNRTHKTTFEDIVGVKIKVRIILVDKFAKVTKIESSADDNRLRLTYEI